MSKPQHESQTQTGSERDFLIKLRDAGFGGDDQAFATALGRPVSEVEGWVNGKEPIDDDVLIKARGIAQQRNIDLE